MKKNILYVISRLSNSGPVNILYGIISNLDLEKYNIYILTLHPENKENTRIDDFKRLVKKVYTIQNFNYKIFLKKNKLMKEIIKKEDIQIIHSHCFFSTILISKFKNIKKICTIHCDILTDFQFKFGKLGLLYSYIYKHFLKKMDILISCGNGVRNLNLQNLKIYSCSIMNGIDLNKINLRNIVASKDILRKKFLSNINKKVFITVGSLDERKNILFLVEVFKYLKNDMLIIIGDGELQKQVKILSNSLENVIYIGRKDLLEVQSFLKASDFYISASKSEGIPNSVLEALQFELPVILSNIPAHSEILEKNQMIGVLFENNNINDCIKAIGIIKNRKIDLKNFSYIRKIISAERMSKDYMFFYERCVKNEYL